MISDLSVKTLINQVKEKQHFSDVFKIKTEKEERSLLLNERCIPQQERESTGESELRTCETDKEISFITISDLNSILLSDVAH